MERQVAKRDTELHTLEADIREQTRNNELCGQLQKIVGERIREMAECYENYKRLKASQEELEDKKDKYAKLSKELEDVLAQCSYLKNELKDKQGELRRLEIVHEEKKSQTATMLREA